MTKNHCFIYGIDLNMLTIRDIVRKIQEQGSNIIVFDRHVKYNICNSVIL